ncbi:MAG: methionyl-tRNA formyltransferase [Clostridia bacterium]|nr:methionyl-tRNA formyltransferase [Clostridia bacterium]
MRVVFMGTPEFAVPTLEELINAGHSVVGVFTQPDKAVGRKQIITPPPVKVCATKHNIPVFQPNTLKTAEAEELIKGLNPEVVVVVAYGKILPTNILSIARYGSINGHASLLPRHRGASPIQWAIVCGDKKTGVTTQLMGEGIDTGDILLSEETDIKEDETAGELHDRLSVITASLMLRTLEGVEAGSITPEKQDDELSNYAPIINKEMGFLRFDKTAEEICNLIRGFNPWPAAYFMLDLKRIKVFSAEVGKETDKAPATVVSSDGELIIACAEGTTIKLMEIQPEGSKRMSAADYLKGHTIRVGTIINGDNVG